MKAFILFIALVLMGGCAGCAFNVHKTFLKDGEKIEIYGEGLATTEVTPTKIIIRSSQKTEIDKNVLDIIK